MLGVVLYVFWFFFYLLHLLLLAIFFSWFIFFLNLILTFDIYFFSFPGRVKQIYLLLFFFFLHAHQSIGDRLVFSPSSLWSNPLPPPSSLLLFVFEGPEWEGRGFSPRTIPQKFFNPFLWLLFFAYFNWLVFFFLITHTDREQKVLNDL